MTDPAFIPVPCQCGKTLKVKSALAGKKVRCPACKAALVVPEIAVTAGDPVEPVSKASAAALPMDAPEKGAADDPFAFLKPAGEVGPGPAGEPGSIPAISVPEIAAPKGSAAKDSAPKDSAPKGSAPKGSAAKDSARSRSKAAATIPDLEPVSPAVDQPTTPVSKVAEDPMVGDQVRETNPYTAASPVATSVQAADGFQPRTYPTLDLIRLMYKVLAFICMGGSVLVSLATIGIAMQGGQGLLIGLFSGVPILIVGAIGGVTMLAASEGIKLMLDIQDNTHRRAMRN